MIDFPWMIDKQSIHQQSAPAHATAHVQQSNVVYESQKQDQVVLSEAEREELTVRARRADGTPCNKENFEAWRRRFDAEQETAALERKREEMAAGGGKNVVTAGVDAGLSDRMTGYDFFMSKAGGDLAALEAAAEAAGEAQPEEEELNEDLFKEEDDVDLDDLDFDDDEDDDDFNDEDDIDDEEEEDVDI
jgi:hypothetical protein